MILNLSDEVLVNSYQFKNDLKKEFNITAQTIYNPLNIKEIIEKSKNQKNFQFQKKIKNIKYWQIYRSKKTKLHF